jgi:predicted MFS family arabinose efflux permease
MKEQPLLREAAAINALGFCDLRDVLDDDGPASFGRALSISAAHMIGLFGLAAAAGALAAPLVGGSADKRNPRHPDRLRPGPASYCLSSCLYIWGDSVAGMIAGIVLLDLAMQCIHVSNQSRVYALIPAARNRLNTVYMTVSFIGTSLGSAIGLFAWVKGSWPGVCLTGGLLTLAAFAVYGATYKKESSAAGPGTALP